MSKHISPPAKLNSFFTNQTMYKTLLLLIFLACLGLSLYLLFFDLGRYPLENWDEAFYGQVAKEMLQTKEFIVLHWNYSIWMDKPPLFMWILSVFGILFGLSELAIRLPSAISAFLILLLISIYAYRKYSVLPALFTFFTLLLNNVFIWRARSGNIDLFVTLLILLSYFLQIGKNKYKYPLLGILFACIYLTKASLVAFPLVIFILSEFFYHRLQIKENIKEYIKFFVLFVGISGLWLLLGDIKAGSAYAGYFLFQSDQGVATLSNFNSHYILHAYYSLQRRFFWLFILGIIFVVSKIKKQEYFLLFLYATLLLVQLSFTQKDNNWYLLPSMPFWSLIIGYAVYMIMKILRKKLMLCVLAISGLVVVSSYIFLKTYRVNILPILNSSSTREQAQSATEIGKLASKKDVIVRLDPLISTTLYYDNHKTLAYFPDTNTHGYWINKTDLLKALDKKRIRWLVGTNEDAALFFKDIDSSRFEQLPVGTEEMILKLK